MSDPIEDGIGKFFSLLGWAILIAVICWALNTPGCNQRIRRLEELRIEHSQKGGQSDAVP
jgi:hypothetical protein